jgi:ketosteroid isomerase-like protein
MSTLSNQAERCLPETPNYPQVLVRIETILQSLAGIRQDLGISKAPGGAGGEAVMDAIHYRLLGYKLKMMQSLPGEILRPLGEKAVLVDMPSGRSFDRPKKGTARHEGYEGSLEGWEQVYPDMASSSYNVIANEDYIVVESVATGTFTEPFVYEADALSAQAGRAAGEGVVEPTGKPVQIFSADVIRLENGEVASFETYYDLAGVMRQMGVMTDIPMGHDEDAAQVPPIMHGAGFARVAAPGAAGTRHAGHHHGPPATPAPRPGTTAGNTGPLPPHAVKGEKKVSVGSSKTARANKNKENCVGIHEAFVQHEPERFEELIAPDAVWVDVPTGQVLNGAVAAAEHDHGNWMTAFPDSDAEITSLIANDDWVVVQHRGFGSHTGPLQLGGKVYRPTGRKMEIKVLDIVQYQDSRAVLIRNYYDVGVMMRQLGILSDHMRA